ncbi:Nn.00g070200.m01.CDS01 [Neocucurbitaria sp. VM-36]
MADALTIVFLILHIIWWPISKLINITVILLSPIWNVARFLSLPFIHLGHTIISILSFPFRTKWLERFETLYIYLGTAGLIGCITGTVLFILFKLLSSTLNIDATIVPEQGARGPTAAEYRAARRQKRDDSVDRSPIATPVALRKGALPRRRGLLSQAIIEEEESDF